jgi:hypothetical protein
VKIIFSRKGFDMGSGGTPSPIINGVPVSLPIPGNPQEIHRYGDISHPIVGPIAPLVEEVTKKRIDASRRAHHDPVLPLHLGQAVLGQMGEAQSHLENQGVGPGDVFLFFGIFRDYDAPKASPEGTPHHRIFGFMQVEKVANVGKSPMPGLWRKLGLEAPHPHTERRDMRPNNTLWIGQGAIAHRASDTLRMTAPDATPSNWAVPAWLREKGLTYHAQADRWGDGHLQLAARGQEFVTDIGDDPVARAWVEGIIQAITPDFAMAA